MTRTLYKVLGDTLSRIDWNDDVREDRLKDLSWVSGDYGEVGFHGYGSVWCYLSENPDLDGACIEDEITIARKQWRRDQRRAAIRALDMDERDERQCHDSDFAWRSDPSIYPAEWSDT